MTNSKPLQKRNLFNIVGSNLFEHVLLFWVTPANFPRTEEYTLGNGYENHMNLQKESKSKGRQKWS